MDEHPTQTMLNPRLDQSRQSVLEPSSTSFRIVPTSETTLDISPDAAIDDIVESTPIVLVKKIVLMSPDGKPFEPPGGVTSARLDEVTNRFVGHAIGSRRINVMVRRLTEVFVAAGFVATHASADSRNLANGVLMVTIHVGRIATFTAMTDPVGDGNRSASDLETRNHRVSTKLTLSVLGSATRGT
ncbi:POTRA domain-containing protein [Burkholderia sp. BCC1988]|uniref:POTRA domain-containing protein n=1 Tax=Burkholderia sp. BCC1988 TaxID=2817443 RepID=UPI002AB2030F|nr:POTRA domain-containing protein [Burkholderia sp. BCC1988]